MQTNRQNLGIEFVLLELLGMSAHGQRIIGITALIYGVGYFI